MTNPHLPKDVEERVDSDFAGYYSGDIKAFKHFLAAELARKDEEKAEAVKQERKRILAWLNKNQSLETKELGKVVLWGWIYEVVKNRPTPEKEAE